MSIKKLNSRVALQNGSLLDPCSGKIYFGDILIEDGRISQIGKISFEGEVEKIDCTGKVVTHGFCDLHVHFREPGREDKETLETGTIAALAGGFTRVCVMPNTNPPLDTPEAISSVAKKAENLPVYIHPIGAITKGQAGSELSEMGLMFRAGAVAFSDDGLPIQNGLVMRKALEYSKMFGVPIINHAEDECLRADGLMNEGKVSTRLGLPGNPNIAESIMVFRDLKLAELTGAKLHVPHVSTADSVKHIYEMKNSFKKVTAEVTPHHLFFSDESLQSYNTDLKVAPPIRDDFSRKALIKAIKDGTIDCIATDHAPHTSHEKETTFDLASCGLIGLESCFGAVKKVLVDDEGLKLMDLLKTLTVSPRKIMGFDSDLIKVGKEAEFVLFDEKEKWVFNKTNILSKSKNSAFLGFKMQGRPIGIINSNKTCINE